MVLLNIFCTLNSWSKHDEWSKFHFKLCRLADLAARCGYKKRYIKGKVNYIGHHLLRPETTMVCRPGSTDALNTVTAAKVCLCTITE